MKKSMFISICCVLLVVVAMILFPPKERNAEEKKIIAEEQEGGEAKEKTPTISKRQEQPGEDALQDSEKKKRSSGSGGGGQQNNNGNEQRQQPQNQPPTHDLSNNNQQPPTAEWSADVFKIIDSISTSEGNPELLMFDAPIKEKGKTTAWYRDEDGDGYGTAKRSDRCYADCGPTRQGMIGDMPDADDNDPTINTPQSMLSDTRYGDPTTNLNQWKKLLEKKFAFPINNVYFIALDGNDATGQPNNILQPFQSFAAVRTLNPTNSDAVIFRQGIYYDPNAPYNAALHIDKVNIPPGNLLIIMAYPGERVILDNTYPVAITNSANILIDGFIITCGQQCRAEKGGFWGGMKGVDLANNNNIIIQNVEITGFRWGIHGSFHWGKTTIRKSVVHDQATEHGIYSPANCYGSTCYEQQDITVEDSHLYRNRRTGYQNNGPAERLRLRRNIIHSNAGAGVTFTRGVENSEVTDNLIFNNNHHGVVIWDDGSVGSRQSNDNNQFANNIIWQGFSWNSVCLDGGDLNNNKWVECSQKDTPANMHAIVFGDNAGKFIFKGNAFTKNIFRTVGVPVFGTSDLSDMQFSIIEDNMFYRADDNPLNGLLSAKWAKDGETDETHDHKECGPCRYFWTLEKLQNHPLWKNTIKNNQIANPLEK